MMFDIVFFDYWKKGTRHFVDINETLKKCGFEPILIHLGSQRGESYADDEIIDGILCRDIAYYNGDFAKMLKIIKPKVVILLNNQTQDKIITRISRGLGIKTVYLMHGVLALNNNLDAAIKNMDSAFGLKERLSRSKKYLQLVKLYFKAVFDNHDGGFIRSFYEVVKYFFIQVYSPASNLYGKYYYLDSITTRCLVYSERDKDNFVKVFKYPAERVAVVGNYNLDKFIAKSSLSKQELSKRYLLYIENGFSDPKLTVAGWSEYLVKNEIVGLAAVAAKYDFDIYVKLHPSSDYDLLTRQSEFPLNVRVFKDSLDDLVINASGVIGQSSSVIVMAIAITKPICILNIDPLRLAIRDYVDDGVGTLVNNLDQFEMWIKSLNISTLGEIDRRKITYLYGPLDGQCGVRIENEIVNLISG